MKKEEKEILKSEAKEKALEFRRRFNIKEEPIEDINSLVFTKEFFIIKFPFDEQISGAYLEKKGRDKVYKCIYINSKEPIGRTYFSFFHEIYHAYFEKGNSNISSYSQSEDPVEIKANYFASNMLIPRKYLQKKMMGLINKPYRNYISMNQLLILQKEFKVSFLALIWAIDELEEKFKPDNLKKFYKYKFPKNWDELEKLSLEVGNKYNSKNDQIVWPRNFKENITKNIECGIISREDVEDIFDFFEG